MKVKTNPMQEMLMTNMPMEKPASRAEAGRQYWRDAGDDSELTDAEKLRKIDGLDPIEDKTRMLIAMKLEELKKIDEEGEMKPRDAYARKQWELEQVNQKLKAIALAHKALGEEPWYRRVGHFVKGTRKKLNDDFAVESSFQGILMRDLKALRQEIES